MAESSSQSDHTISPFPDPSTSTTDSTIQPSTSPVSSSSSSVSSSSSSESEAHPSSQSPRPSRRSRLTRPRLQDRPRSSIIVPKDKTMQSDRPEYPPDDARAMSPRRNSQDLEKLGMEVRENLKDQARTLQSSLAALAERIDEVKSGHDKLESENRFLQDYIGGLTRTMSQRDLGGSVGKPGKSRR